MIRIPASFSRDLGIWVLAVVAIFPFLTISGCRAENKVAEGTAQRLTMAVSDTANVRSLELSHTPNDAANGLVRADTLSVDLRLGGIDDGFGHIADVTTLSDGRIAVLDRAESVVWLYNATGSRLGKWGGEGAGPGEFRVPIALLALRNHVVVFELNHERPFTVFDLAGNVMSTMPPGVLPPGDLSMASRRGTLQMLDWPYQMSSEDWTRRVGPYDESSFVFQLQPDERHAAMQQEEFPFDAPPVTLVRISAAAEVLDTLATSVAPPSRRLPDLPRAEPQFDQPIFAPRPLWTGGDGWFALGHGRERTITIKGSAATAILTWPDNPRLVTEADKTEAALWLKRIGMRDLSTGEEIRQEWESASAAEREEWIDFHRRYWAFPDTAPEVTALYGAGDCLWLAGLSPVDYADGTALTWVGVNVREKNLAGVVAVPRRGARIRHFSESAVYASYRDGRGIDYLERYPLPEATCRALGLLPEGTTLDTAKK